MKKSDHDNRDLIDLCRLNLMEEHVKGSLLPDRDATLHAIDLKRRQVATRIINDAQEGQDG